MTAETEVDEAANAEATELDEEDVSGTAGPHFSDEQVAQLNARLDRRLIKSKEGKGLYLEAYTVINHLNRIFGYGSWSRNVDAVESEEGPDGILYVARVTLSVRAPDGSVSQHQDEGATLAPRKRGETSNSTISGSSRRTARLGAISDGLKRAARSFGEQFANSLYDKSYMQARDAEDREAARASAQAQRATTQAGQKPKDTTARAVALQRAQDLLSRDPEARAKLPKPLAEQTDEQVQKTINWLVGRANAAKKGETYRTGPVAGNGKSGTDTAEVDADVGSRKDELTAYVNDVDAHLQAMKGTRGPLTAEQRGTWTALYTRGQALAGPATGEDARPVVDLKPSEIATACSRYVQSCLAELSGSEGTA